MLGKNKINASKTKVFFFNNVNHVHAQELSLVLGFSYTSDLGKYLGVPLLHKRVKKETYVHLLTKSKKKLSTWKALKLSFAGKITLTKIVLEALPS